MVNYMRFCLYEMCEPDVLNLRFLNRFLLIDLYQVISVWGCITYPIILVNSTHHVMLIYVNSVYLSTVNLKVLVTIIQLRNVSQVSVEKHEKCIKNGCTSAHTKLEWIFK